jgi:endonuclease-3
LIGKQARLKPSYLFIFPFVLLRKMSKKRGHIAIEYESESDSPRGKWESTYQKIKTMRAEIQAPVDVMGCAHLADKNESPEVQRFQTLISLLLSSQTKDQVTAQAMENLKQHGLTIENVIKTDVKKIDQMISKVGFHERKAQYLKAVAQILKDQYNGDIPDTLEGLIKLPGIGPKMAYLTMQNAWNKNEGIGVDVHVHRISNRLGWVKTESRGPEDTRKQLESFIPKTYWKEFNGLFVGFGQTICQPVLPKCENCILSDGTCPSAKKYLSAKKTKKAKKRGCQEGDPA